MGRLMSLLIAGTVLVCGCGKSLPPLPAGAVKSVTWKGKTFTTGDRVRLISKSGTFKPADTGHGREIKVDSGYQGTVLWGEKRNATSYFTPDPDEAFQIVRVRWDAATWTDDSGKKIDLKPFGATMHVEYLDHD